MTLQAIAIPDSIKHLPYGVGAEDLIDSANDAIESFWLAQETTIENFVTSDYHLLDQAITWIEQNHLLAGDRFCEWGAGFGIGAMLAALRGMESFAIEIEPPLAAAGNRLAETLVSPARLYCGSLVPRGMEGIDDFAGEIKNVETEAGDVYEEIGLTIEDFDLIFAFPWPGEHVFFEHVFHSGAAVGAMLLTYRGREGMHLARKVSSERS